MLNPRKGGPPGERVREIPGRARKMIDFLAEIAKADGIVLDNEKFSLDDLSNLWEVESRL